MLREWIAAEMPEEEELKNRLEAAREKMAVQQLQMKEKKVPVLVLVEGWGTSGKGSSIGRIIQNIDPRFFKVFDMEKKTEEDARKPFLQGKLSEKEYAKRIESVQRFERQLTDNGYLVVKLFLNISKKEQEKRISRLTDEKDTAWRVGSYDLWQNEHYEKCQ